MPGRGFLRFLPIIDRVEMLVADVGFGYRLRMQSRLLNMNVVYIYLAILAVSFFFIDWSLRFARRRMCPWFGS